MLVTPFGIVMLVSEVHLKNVVSPMLITLSGIVMLVIAAQSQNARSAINIVPLFNANSPLKV